MSTIDWSKAPEGATHFNPRAETLLWYRIQDGCWEFFNECWEWEVSSAYQCAIEGFIARPTPWVGEGPPPVGTVCEFHGAGAACPDDPWHPDLKDGDHVTIIAYFNDSVGQVAAFTFKARNENIASIQVEQARPGAFQPIRTQEQIAADKRLHEIRNALTTIKAGQQPFPNDLVRGNITLSVVEAMIDAGYRVQVMP